jgi:hypothetical protein
MSSWTPTTYKTKNWSNYNRALKQRGSLSIQFDAEMEWDAEPSGTKEAFQYRRRIGSGTFAQHALDTRY